MVSKSLPASAAADNTKNMHRITLTEAAREELRAARRRRGVRIKVIARAIGISPRAVDSWQGGTRRPSAEQLAAWCRIVFGPPA